MAQKNPIIITEEQLLNPTIPVDTVNSLIYEGDLTKLLKLYENPRFIGYNQEAWLAMGKAKILWYQNTEIQIGIVMSMIIISLFFQFDFKIINFILFSIMIILFLRLKSFNITKKNTETERILYIQKMLKNTEYSIDHLIN